MKKAEIQKELEQRGIPYEEKDKVSVLKNKLNQTKAIIPKKESPSLPYMLMDRQDDTLILQELQGAVIEHLVYSFKDRGGKEITSLSKAGVDQTVLEMSNKKNFVYEVVDTNFREDEKYFYVDVKVERSRLLFNRRGEYKGKIPMGSATGHKRQAKKVFTRKGLQDDQFAYEKAFSKAERNAKMSLIPKPFVLEMIKLFRKKGQVKEITLEQKIGSAELRTIHAVGAELGLNHEKIKDLVRDQFGYESLNEIEKGQLQEVMELLKGMEKPRMPKIPMELIGFFNEKGTLKAKREAIWSSVLKEVGGEVNKAVEVIKTRMRG